MSIPVRQRNQRKLAYRTEQRLLAYARAAGASGVAALALAPSYAKAEVIFTPAHVTINPGNTYFLDLNHDGINDFRILNSQSLFFGVVILPEAGASNGIVGTNVFTTFNASALQAGYRVGRGDKFQTTPALLAASFRSSSGQIFRLGEWINVQNRFLGLKFDINGQIHYGWARLTVRNGNLKSTALLTGYAYETNPDRGVRTGQKTTDQAAGVSDQQPPRLGMLALGTVGLKR